jgi:hypothetical protein
VARCRRSIMNPDLPLPLRLDRAVTRPAKPRAESRSAGADAGDTRSETSRSLRPLGGTRQVVLTMPACGQVARITPAKVLAG